MRFAGWMCAIGVLAASGCSRGGTSPQVAAIADPPARHAADSFVGFDRNEYPGDDTMKQMRSAFAFTGYWLTVPPGAMFNQWKGKRELLKQQGWGFLVLANGKLEKEILAAQKKEIAPEALGRNDAAAAVAAAKSEGFPAHTIIFLDQEEGGRLTPPQAAYLLAWTEAVAASAYRPGVYASGQPVQDDPGVTIDTIQDIRSRIKNGHLNSVAMFDAQDQCPPAPGCTLQPRPLTEAGESDLVAWQYAQSPRRPEITQSCAKTYASDGNCYAPDFPKIFLDMDVAASPDPSHGR